MHSEPMIKLLDLRFNFKHLPNWLFLSKNRSLGAAKRILTLVCLFVCLYVSNLMIVGPYFVHEAHSK